MEELGEKQNPDRDREILISELTMKINLLLLKYEELKEKISPDDRLEYEKLAQIWEMEDLKSIRTDGLRNMLEKCEDVIGRFENLEHSESFKDSLKSSVKNTPDNESGEHSQTKPDNRNRNHLKD